MFVIFRRLSGFFIILALIIFGFGIVFFEFNRSTPFPLHLVESYNALFGNSNTTYDSVSKNVLSISVAGVLNVYLLNMLVTVIGDSLHAIQDVSILTDSKERIDLIMESTLVKRVLWRKKPIDFKKKCIVFCEQTGFNENDEVDELKSRIVELQDKIGRIEERFGNDMARFEEHMFRMEEKIDETLNKKLELIMHHVVDKNDELSEKAHNVVTQEFSARKRRTGHHLYQGNENYYSPS